MELRIDHVAFGWSGLEGLTEHVATMGLEPEYGGTHRDGTTEMSLLGFDDGSYLEFIAPTGEGRPARWPDHLLEDGGPAAWAIRVDEISTFAKQMIDRGVRIEGPIHDHRIRPDGVRVEWDHCYLGGSSMRSILPFALADRTPHAYRTTPTEQVAESSIQGIDQVVLAVEDLGSAVAWFKRIFRLPVPKRETHGDFEATLAHFPGYPVTLAEPAGHSWLRPRLDEFGRGPAAVLLETADMAQARNELSLTVRDRWFGRRYATFESERLGYQVGVIEGES